MNYIIYILLAGILFLIVFSLWIKRKQKKQDIYLILLSIAIKIYELDAQSHEDKVSDKTPPEEENKDNRVKREIENLKVEYIESALLSDIKMKDKLIKDMSEIKYEDLIINKDSISNLIKEIYAKIPI